MASEHKVTVYSTPTCPYCIQVKKYLSEKGIEYTDFDVASDLKAREEMMAKSKQMGVPVLDIDGTIVIGFNRAKIDELTS